MNDVLFIFCHSRLFCASVTSEKFYILCFFSFEKRWSIMEYFIFHCTSIHINIQHNSSLCIYEYVLVIDIFRISIYFMWKKNIIFEIHFHIFSLIPRKNLPLFDSSIMIILYSVLSFPASSFFFFCI